MKSLSLLAGLVLVAVGSLVQAQSVSGEVLEVRQVDSYTYLRLKLGDRSETWAAVPTTTLAKGARVSISNPATMHNFESKTLGKTFDTILFGQIAAPAKPLAAPGGTAPAAPVAAAGPIKVSKASGPNAHTVAELVSGKDALQGQSVLLRAQVVKVNRGILGKNWLHLQDGSGNAASGNNDILVTTLADAAVGDVVSARGKVRTKVALGAGYSYAVLIEDAVLAR